MGNKAVALTPKKYAKSGKILKMLIFQFKHFVIEKILGFIFVVLTVEKGCCESCIVVSIEWTFHTVCYNPLSLFRIINYLELINQKYFCNIPCNNRNDTTLSTWHIIPGVHWSWSLWTINVILSTHVITNIITSKNLTRSDENVKLEIKTCDAA